MNEGTKINLNIILIRDYWNINNFKTNLDSIDFNYWLQQ